MTALQRTSGQQAQADRRNHSLSRLALLFIPIACLAQSRKLIVRNASIMTMAEGQRAPIAGYLSVAPDGTILAVAAGEPPASLHAATVVDAHGDYIIPGFISAHTHLNSAPYPGLGAEFTLHGWSAARGKHDHSTAEDSYWFTLYGALDILEHGVTTAYNFAVAHNANATDNTVANDEAYQKSQLRAEVDSGIRFEHGFPIGDTTTPQGLERTRTLLQAFLKLTATQQPSPHFLKVMLSGATGGGQSEGAAVLMKEFHLANQTHFLEPPDSVGEQQSNFRAMMDTGLLSHDLYFGHFIHTNDFILEQSAKAGVGMSWQPLSNGRLGSGVADIPKYLKMGIRVGMGLDSASCADLMDPFENMRTGLYAVRDKYEDAGIMSPYQVLWLHTMGSADVMGIKDKVGSLEPGKFADFLLINPAGLGVALEDPYANLVFVAAEQDLDSVYIGGDLQVDHGKMLHHDLPKIEADVYGRVRKENQ
jgi:5-methylthioadenosine/S-adenosylhomocysteine deaminase